MYPSKLLAQLYLYVKSWNEENINESEWFSALVNMFKSFEADAFHENQSCSVMLLSIAVTSA